MFKSVYAYVRENISLLADSYPWGIPSPLPAGITLPGSEASLLERNLALKDELHVAWSTGSAHERLRLCHWYISVWGGVRRNDEETLRLYANGDEATVLARGKQGIASWSKAFTIRDPKRFAIFDARTSIALNAIQVRAGVEPPIVFPALPSRNKRVVAAQLVVKRLVSAHGWQKVDHHAFYIMYCRLVEEIAVKLCTELKASISNQMVEMLLFANAIDLSDELCATYA
ncbi:hypothetical protein [Paraburkholderia dinghuensis]|uniref:Uncharacterized protein n=1 Tax=Paraburkholderia dinghuensis TaxID=2305225 RepID=A0A3N6PH59_9BURK|nr:hypothetical protein [Paraburkholderia dinghuensis]RQG99819.1 hypothetical protein D1Y85_26190 [Paraburkholderia dinghuensis]